MLNLEELKQLVSFAELGTLSKVAEEYHISTPSITRSMQHLEESMGVPLFVRGKNKIELNETGVYAVEAGKKLLEDAEQTLAQIRAFDQRRKTIVIRSCAPAPLWTLLRTELGFWDTLCRQKMPASKFLVQTDEFTFKELIEASSLPCFTTDYRHFTSLYDKRINIPITDPEANVTFYLAAKEDGILKDIKLIMKGES